MRSSYCTNSYGSLFTALAKIHDPKLMIELGVLDGYSLLALAEGASSDCQIYAYDLFDDYEFKHGSEEDVQSLLNDKRYSNVSLLKGDAIAAAKSYENNSVDFLHVDISNDGDILGKVYNAWYDKIKKGGLFIFEGGSVERDNVDWMVKYKKTPISIFKLAIQSCCHLDNTPCWEITTFDPYPSLTVCKKL